MFEEKRGSVLVFEDGSVEDKVVRLLNLLPMAFTIVEEARETIARLRDEVDKARQNGWWTGRIYTLA